MKKKLIFLLFFFLIPISYSNTEESIKIIQQYDIELRDDMQIVDIKANIHNQYLAILSGKGFRQGKMFAMSENKIYGEFDDILYSAITEKKENNIIIVYSLNNNNYVLYNNNKFGPFDEIDELSIYSNKDNLYFLFSDLNSNQKRLFKNGEIITKNYSKVDYSPYFNTFITKYSDDHKDYLEFNNKVFCSFNMIKYYRLYFNSDSKVYFYVVYEDNGKDGIAKYILDKDKTIIEKNLSYILADKILALYFNKYNSKEAIVYQREESNYIKYDDKIYGAYNKINPYSLCFSTKSNDLYYATIKESVCTIHKNSENVRFHLSSVDEKTYFLIKYYERMDTIIYTISNYVGENYIYLGNNKVGPFDDIKKLQYNKSNISFIYKKNGKWVLSKGNKKIGPYKEIYDYGFSKDSSLDYYAVSKDLKKTYFYCNGIYFDISEKLYPYSKIDYVGNNVIQYSVYDVIENNNKSLYKFQKIYLYNYNKNKGFIGRIYAKNNDFEYKVVLLKDSKIIFSKIK